MTIEMDDDIITGLKLLSAGTIDNQNYMSNLNGNELELVDDAIHWVASLPELEEEE